MEKKHSDEKTITSDNTYRSGLRHALKLKDKLYRWCCCVPKEKEIWKNVKVN